MIKSYEGRKMVRYVWFAILLQSLQILFEPEDDLR